MRRYVILGDGVAGVGAAFAIRQRDPEGSITIITGEETPFYSRPLIVDVMTGERTADGIVLLTKEGHRARGFTLVTGSRIGRIDAGRRVVHSGSHRHPFDSLLIATGAEAKSELSGTGVFTLRTVRDAEAIGASLGRVKRAIVSGGGPVGMKAAYALLRKGIPVTILVSSSHILSRVLDARAASRIEDLFSSHGATILLNRGVAGLIRRRGLKGIVTDRGEEVGGEVLIVGKGVRVDFSLAAEAGIACDRGILADGRLETNIPGIFAAGDAAQAKALPSAEREVVSLWPVAAAHGRVAGANMAGADLSYDGAIPANSVEFFGVTCISMGILSGPDLEESTFEEGDTYRKYVFRGDRLAGALCLGAIDNAGVLMESMRRQIPVRNSKGLFAITPLPARARMEVLF